MVEGRHHNSTNATYDYVVIGGGTAGITIASRLAETPGTTVALVEAGGFYETESGNTTTIPGLSILAPYISTAVPVQGQEQSPIDWGLITASLTGADGRTIHYPQGKTFGGSSALNTMAYHRATIGTYDRWASVVGDDAYKFANLLPSFKRTCHLSPPDLELRSTPNSTVLYDPSAFEATGGPLQVSWPLWVDKPLTWFQKAFDAIGLPVSRANFNSGDLLNQCAWITTTVDPSQAVRSSSQSAFGLSDNRTNGLTLYRNTQAQRILFGFDKQTNRSRANGVLVQRTNSTSILKARKEIIVSAGVFHSPQLLMVSGVGPKTTLAKFGIPVLSDLPGVGQNLWDQILFSVSRPIDVPSALQLITLPNLAAETQRQYTENKNGPLSSENGLIAFEKIPQSLRQNFTPAALQQLDSLPSDWPEIEYIANSAVTPTGESLGLLLGALSASFSRGTVTLRSADMTDQPIIDLAWLTDENNVDAQVAVAAVKRIRQAWDSLPSNFTVGPELAPGPQVQSDAEILAYVRNSTSTLYHAAGTCAMGREKDPMAVVDSHARVFGVSGLRVVDNSISPFAVPGHPQSNVYMLAEKIAELIKRGG